MAKKLSIMSKAEAALYWLNTHGLCHMDILQHTLICYIQNEPDMNGQAVNEDVAKFLIRVIETDARVTNAAEWRFICEE